MLPLSSVISSVLVVGGTPALTVKPTPVVAGLTLPAASVTVTLSEWLPLLNVGVVKLQVPSLPTVTLPSSVLPS